MNAIMLCETCKLPIFYDEDCDEFTCPHCGEEYEFWTEEDVEMIVNVMEHMLSFWAWNKVLKNPNRSDT